jgi:general stress protein YciG
MSKANRGFASLAPEKRRHLASLGGLAAHKKGRAHEWTPAEARMAGRKGGTASRAARQERAPEKAGVGQ